MGISQSDTVGESYLPSRCAIDRRDPVQTPTPAAIQPGCLQRHRHGSNWPAARRGPYWLPAIPGEAPRSPATLSAEQCAQDVRIGLRWPPQQTRLASKRRRCPDDLRAAHASSRMRSEFQPSCPKCTARAIAARRPVADEPQPMPRGTSLFMRIASGITGLPFSWRMPPVDAQDEVLFQP